MSSWMKVTAIATYLIFLMLGCAASQTGGTHRDAPSTHALRMPNRTLKLSFRDETYVVPEPATIPEEMRQSDQYRQWEERGNAQTLTWTAPDGRRYVCQTMGFSTDANGVRIPLIPRIAIYRPDGTLENETLYDPADGPAQWTIYHADGRSKRLTVINRLHGLPGTPFIQYVRFFDTDGGWREYQANRLGIVHTEMFFDKTGNPYRFNGSSRYDQTANETTPN